MLSLELGILPSELSRRMLAYEEVMFMGLMAERAWGEEAADLRNAQLMTLLHNKDIPSKHSSKRRKVTDFLPFYRKKVTVQDDVADRIRAMFPKKDK